MDLKSKATEQTFASLTLTEMTKGSVLFAGAGGTLLQDNANLFWDNISKRLTVTGATITGCSVLGLNSAIFQPTTDSTTFFQVLDADGGTPILNIDTTNERVGIGTASPQQLLHLSADNATMNEAIRLQNTGSNVGDEIGIYFRHYTDGRLQAFIKDEITSGWPTKLHFGTAAGENNAATKMTIDGSGNVGIGTASPQTTLHIKSTTGGVGLRLDRAANTKDAFIQFATGGTTDWYVGLDNSPVKDHFQIKTTNNAVPEFIIRTSGNVGIGVTDPATKLEVNGTIRGLNSLFLGEQASALADVEGKGQMWVKNATPNELWFTDDAGTDHQIAFV